MATDSVGSKRSRSASTSFLVPDFDRMPQELRSLNRWVVWRDDKIPYCAEAVNSKASTDNPDTWSSLEASQTAYEEGGYSGVGFVLIGDDIAGVDLDKCVSDGLPDPRALALLQRIGCEYVEFSPSGTGLRGFGRATACNGRRGTVNGIRCELYTRGRYLTVTGHALLQGPLAPLAGFGEVWSELTAGRSRSPACSPTEETEATEDLLIASVSSVAGWQIRPGLLPTREGERNQKLFELARYVKGTAPHLTRDERLAVVRDWFRAAEPVIGTKDFEVTWADFEVAFTRVKQPYGESLKTVLCSMPECSALALPPGYGEKMTFLLRICMALDTHAAPMPFFISSRKVGELLLVHYTVAAALLRQLVIDGLLELIELGRGNRASRYRLTDAGRRYF